MISLSAQVQDIRPAAPAFPLPAIKRRLGFPSGTTEISGSFAPVFEESLLLASGLIEPRIVFRCCTPQNRSGSVITLRECELYLESEKVAALLHRSVKIVLFYATVGAAVSEAVRRLGAEGKMTEQLALDAIASETADAVADHFHHVEAAGAASRSGLRVTARFSPGYGDWPLTVQPRLAEVCDAGRIGIHVDDSCFMEPAKSVSAVFGLERI